MANLHVTLKNCVPDQFHHHMLHKWYKYANHQCSFAKVCRTKKCQYQLFDSG